MGKLGRSLTDVRLRALILIRQEGRCGYCNISLFGKDVKWDHFIPWSYLDSSGGKDNWVATCLRCNLKKSNKVFRNEEDMIIFCNDMIASHGSFAEGWEEGSDHWQSKLMAQATPRDTPLTPSEWVLSQLEKENVSD